MSSYFNDPLGAMSKGLSTANSAIQTNVKYAAEKIKNNENLKQSLANAHEKASYGLSATAAAAGTAASNAKAGAQGVYA